MCQLSCKPPLESFRPHSYRFCFFFLKHLKLLLGACLYATIQSTTGSHQTVGIWQQLPGWGEGTLQWATHRSSLKHCLFRGSRTQEVRDVGLPHNFFFEDRSRLLAFPRGGTSTLAFSHDCSRAGMGSRDTTLS